MHDAYICIERESRRRNRGYDGVGVVDRDEGVTEVVYGAYIWRIKKIKYKNEVVVGMMKEKEALNWSQALCKRKGASN